MEKFKTDLILKRIEEKYTEPDMRLKTIHFCRDIEIKQYRFNRIVEGKAFFQTNEILKAMEVLDIKDNEVVKYFLDK